MKAMYKQRGATLIVGLIMLILLTLLGISAFNTSTSHFRVIGNMQYQAEASACAQSALNEMLSHGVYFTDPTTTPASLTCDINGDGTTDYTVTLVQPCVLKSVPILLSELSPTSADDLKCMGSAAGKNTGIMGQNTGAAASECARVTWRVTANLNDSFTRAATQITEGTSVRMDRAVADAYVHSTTPSYKCTS